MYNFGYSMIGSIRNFFDGNELYTSFCEGLERCLEDRKKGARFFSFLHANQFTIKDTGIKYRVINHWSQQGLLIDSRDEKGSSANLTLFKKC